MKNKNDVLRLKSIVRNDRFSAGDEFYEMVISDASKTLREYFDFKDNVSLNVTKAEGGYRVSVNFFAESVKPFTKVP